MTLAGLGMMAGRYITGQGIKSGMNALGDAVSTFAGGKMGESVGSYNEGASDKLRETARKYNIDPNSFAQAMSEHNESSKNSQQGRDFRQQAFNSQLIGANNRANSVLNMAERDQQFAQDRAAQLADGYRQASDAQGQASANIINAMSGMNRR